MKIDKHGSTWKAVERFIEQERKDAINFIWLIAIEKQRGALTILERLEGLVREDSDTPA